MAREPRLDFWRGLCLIDVVLVHLAYNDIGFPAPIDAVVKHYARFGAGGFTFLAGLTVAVVFGPRVDGGTVERRHAYRRLLRRAAVLVLVDVSAAAAYRLLDAARAFPADPGTPLAEALWSIVLLQRPGLTGGILVLYAILLLLTPALLEIRRRLGAWPLAAASAGLYVAAVATDGVLHWPHNDFPLLYWQPLFVAGVLSARVHRWLLAGHIARRAAWVAVSGVAFSVVFLAAHGPELGISGVAHTLPLDFTKTPLAPGALLWYLSIVELVLATTALAWGRLAARPSTAAVSLLGRHSLLAYTAHVFTEAMVLEYVWSAWPPAGVRMALAAVDLLTLTLLSAAAEVRAPSELWSAPLRLARTRPRLTRGLIAACLLAAAATVYDARARRRPGVAPPAEVDGPAPGDARVVPPVDPEPAAEPPAAAKSSSSRRRASAPAHA